MQVEVDWPGHNKPDKAQTNPEARHITTGCTTCDNVLQSSHQVFFGGNACSFERQHSSKCLDLLYAARQAGTGPKEPL